METGASMKAIALFQRDAGTRFSLLRRKREAGVSVPLKARVDR
jgi:hypothetical protein